MLEIKRGDLFWADLNPFIGSEQGGIRPVLIIQNDDGNRHSPTTIIAPITKSMKKSNIETHVKISKNLIQEDSVVLLEQIKTIDKNRLKNYINTLGKHEMNNVDRAIIVSLFNEKKDKIIL